ncbi:hypothetical protein PCAU_3153 [Pseudomonas chlororaphis subsp. aurantiaca]|nr:hypothetical protein PCAU_3153 [Pseudomonas chlororaphis subsp. aurantiaca]
MLAMDVNDCAYRLDERGALESIASKLAPTGGGRIQRWLACNGGCAWGMAEEWWLRIFHWPSMRS